MSEAPRRLVLLRHGRTAWNLAGRAQGQTDVPLDEVGLAQAEAAAPYLAAYAPTRLWSSDLARAVQTAERIAAATGLVVETSPAFREYAVGDRAGLTVAEFAERFPHEHAAWRAGVPDAVPGSESHDDVRTRFVPALEKALGELGPGECGVLVSHGAALRTGVFAALGLPVEVHDALVGLGNCHWIELVESASVVLANVGETRWRLHGYNLSAPSAALDAALDSG
jgi:probable phosphoglycerate mutase